MSKLWSSTLRVGDRAKAEWWDSAGSLESFCWDNPPDMSPILMTTVGWVAAVTEDHLTLVMDVWDGREGRMGRNWMTIPTRCIVSLCVLREDRAENAAAMADEEEGD